MKIPNDELKKGVELCFKNASSLIEDAKILVEQGSYGHARFLALSAIEEICKAFIYAMNRIEVWKDDELTRDVFSHKSKFSIFVSFLLLDAIGKEMGNGQVEIKKPLDIDDLVKMGRDLESAINDMKRGREESLYVDYEEGKWVSPYDVPREETESWIKFAQTKNTELELFCRNTMNAPIELARKFQDFLDNQFLPLVGDKFIDELYKNNVISRTLYEKIKAKRSLSE